MGECEGVGLKSRLQLRTDTCWDMSVRAAAYVCLCVCVCCMMMDLHGCGG